MAPVADRAKQLGFAPVKLGRLNEGGALVHTRGRILGPADLPGPVQEGAVTNLLSTVRGAACRGPSKRVHAG
jgi:hypothetical protein